MKAYMPGILIILVGIVLFWCGTRKTLSPQARMFLEGQATVCIPAGLAAIGVGAWSRRNGRNGNGKSGA